MNLTEYITDVGKITNKVYRPTFKGNLAIRIWHFDTRRPAYYILPGICS